MPDEHVSAEADEHVDVVETGPDRIAIPSAHPVVIYSLLRLGILAAVGGVLYLVGVRGVWLILFGFLVSGVISAVVLSRRREGAAYGITRAVRSVNSRIDASSRAEDANDDAEFEPGGVSGPTTTGSPADELRRDESDS